MKVLNLLNLHLSDLQKLKWRTAVELNTSRPEKA
jgi:hypothetical protein